MANPTGRTTGKFFKLQIGATSSTSAVLADIPVETLNGVGLTYPEIDLTALQDALKGFLPGQPSASLTITGPFDNTALVTCSTSGQAAALSGSHTVLSVINGGVAPLTLGIYVGIREYWTTGDPVFGIAHTSANGVIVTDYKVDMATMKYSAKIAFFPGSSAPTWGSAALA
jgi:hypothetical protein